MEFTCQRAAKRSSPTGAITRASVQVSFAKNDDIAFGEFCGFVIRLHLFKKNVHGCIFVARK